MNDSKTSLNDNLTHFEHELPYNNSETHKEEKEEEISLYEQIENLPKELQYDIRDLLIKFFLFIIIPIIFILISTHILIKNEFFISTDSNTHAPETTTTYP